MRRSMFTLRRGPSGPWVLEWARTLDGGRWVAIHLWSYRLDVLLAGVWRDLVIAAWVMFTWACVAFTMVMGAYAMAWHY